MIDFDVVHSIAQFPVSVIELTVASTMAARWVWARAHADNGEARRIDTTVTLLLAVFIGLIGMKQSFWSVWGALKAADLFVAADSVEAHWWPIVNNVAITGNGLLLVGRIGSVVYGRASYVVSAATVVALFSVGAALSARGI